MKQKTIKDIILEISGLTESKFYKTYKTEEDFMKKHGKQFNKAIKKLQGGGTLTNFGYHSEYDDWLWRNVDYNRDPNFNPKVLPTIGAQMPTSTYDTGELATMNTVVPKTGKFNIGDLLTDTNVLGGIDVAGKVAEGIKKLKEERRALRRATQTKGVSEAYLAASRTRPEQTLHRYVRPEDNIIGGDKLFPTYGTGTSILAKYGGRIPKAEDGELLTDRLGNIIGGLSGREDNAGAAFGEAVGGAVAMIPGIGPIASQFVKPVGKVLGTFLDRKPVHIRNKMEAAYGNFDKVALGEGMSGLFSSNRSIMEEGGKIASLPARFNINLADNLQEMENVYSDTKTFNKKGISYLDESYRLDNEIDKIRNKGTLRMRDWTKLRELRLAKEDLMSHQLKNMKQGGTLPSYMEYEGEVSTDKGNVKPISYNPYLPGRGESLMFEGPSHERGGMLLSYGGPSKGGMAEVEGGETAFKFDEGGNNEDLVIFGNMKVPDKKYKGKKYKNVIKDIAKQENKQNKIIEDSMKELELIDINDSFDKLKVNSLKKNVEGADAKLRNLAEEKLNLASMQLEQLEAKEAKKKAKEGGIIKAAEGASVSGSEDSWMGLIRKYFPPEAWDDAYRIMMGESGGNPSIPSAYNKRGTEDSHGLFQINLKAHPHMRKKVLDPEENVKFAAQLYKKNGWRDWSNTAKSLGIPLKGSKPSPLDSYSDKQLFEMMQHPTLGRQIYEYITPQAIKDYVKSIGGDDKTYEQRPDWIKKIEEAASRVQSGEPYIGGIATAPGGPIGGAAGAAAKGASKWLKILKGVLKIGFASGVVGAGIYGATKLFGGSDEEEKRPPTHQEKPLWEIPLLDDDEGDVGVVPAYQDENALRGSYPLTIPDEELGMYDDIKISPITKIEEGVGKEKEDEKSTLERALAAVSSYMPQFVPTTKDYLDPRQLYGELSTLMEHEMPVHSQFYQPQLLTPYSVSLHDKIAEIDAQTRSAMRMAEGNPAAQAIIAAQANRAKSEVLSEQFRLNQMERDRVYSGNIGMLNEAQLKNIELGDKQYERQAMSEANTRNRRLAALSSIGDKFVKKEHENRMMNALEQLYNYRQDRSGRFWNYNPPAQFTLEGSGMGDYEGTMHKDGIYRMDVDAKTGKKEIVGWRKSKETSRNGGLVRAIK